MLLDVPHRVALLDMRPLTHSVRTAVILNYTAGRATSGLGGALSQLALHVANWVPIAQEGGIAGVVAALGRFMGHVSLVAHGCQALWQLALNDAFQAAAGRVSCVAILMVYPPRKLLLVIIERPGNCHLG